jgi:predicted nucleic-acid-binding protein
MIALDTNVLVRYLVQDDPVQCALTNQIIEREENLFLSCIVICELVWVLDVAYHAKKKEIATVLEKILLTRQFQIEDKDDVWMALSDYSKSDADFSDCLIGRKNQTLGCEFTASFDKKATELHTFQLLK